MTTEAYTVTITYTLDNETEERTFRTRVTIKDSDPFTEVADRAVEKLYAKHGSSVEVLEVEEAEAPR